MKARVMMILLAACACRARAPSPPEPPPLDHAPPTAHDDDEEQNAPVLEGVPRPFVMGILPIFSPEEMTHAYAPLAAYLGEQLGTVVEIELSPDYNSMVDHVASGRVDLVQLAPLAYVIAKQKTPSLELLVTNISEGASSYSGYLLARADSGIRTLEDLRGKRIGFVDTDSASGYLYPYAFLLDRGVDPERYFRERTFTRRHDLAMADLNAGRIDAAATFSGALRNAELNGIDTNRLAIIAKTGRIPYDAWCTTAKVPAPVAARVKEALLAISMRTPKGRRILGPLHSINGFAPASDSTYDEIRRVKALVDQATE